MAVSNNKKMILILLLTIICTSHAMAEDESYESYDTIINELSSKQSSLLSSYSSHPIHIGFGYVNSTSKINGPSIPVDKMTLQGAQLSLGMDIFENFSSNVQLTYLTPNTKNNTEMEAMEFDLVGLFKPELGRVVDGRFGLGLGIRNVDIKAPQTQTEFTNPLAMLIAGIEAKITKQVGFVTEVTLKNSLTSSNAEKHVVDFGLRVDGHF